MQASFGVAVRRPLPLPRGIFFRPSTRSCSFFCLRAQSPCPPWPTPSNMEPLGGRGRRQPRLPGGRRPGQSKTPQNFFVFQKDPTVTPPKPRPQAGVFPDSFPLTALPFLRPFWLPESLTLFEIAPFLPADIGFTLNRRFFLNPP